MNVNQLTQKSIEAVQAAQQLASERNNTEVSQAHLLYTLVAQPDGLIGSILSATGVDLNRIRTEAGLLYIDVWSALHGKPHARGEDVILRIPSTARLVEGGT